MDLPGAVAGLGGSVERLQRRLDQVENMAAAARTEAEQTARVLDDLVDRVEAVAHTRPAGSPALTSWLACHSPDDAQDLLTTLVDWINQVYIRYRHAAESLGECWLWHPAAVEELLAAQSAWHDAYEGETASGLRALDWHDRLPGVIRRVRDYTSGCSLSRHSHGGPERGVPARAPGTSAVADIARWWGDGRDLAAEPAPTPDQLAEADAIAGSGSSRRRR